MKAKRSRSIGKSRVAVPAILLVGFAAGWSGVAIAQDSPPELLAAPFNRTEAEAWQQAWAQFLGTSVVVEDSAGISFAIIPAGEFQMGSSSNEIAELRRLWPRIETSILDDEAPHRVRLPQPFFVGIHEVTVGQFRQFVSDTGYETEAKRHHVGGRGWSESTKTFEGPSTDHTWQQTGWSPYGESHPVVNVTWNDAIAFCNWLSVKNGLDPFYSEAGANERVAILGGGGYRLLTEAEWEFACRAGTTTIWHNGGDPERLVTVGNITDLTAHDAWADDQHYTYVDATDGYAFSAPVGSFEANNFGLFDMHGNVYEWCWDAYDANAFRWRADIAVDPIVNRPETIRVLRGGSWVGNPQFTRAANRGGLSPSYCSHGIGFRVARTP